MVVKDSHRFQLSHRHDGPRGQGHANGGAVPAAVAHARPYRRHGQADRNLRPAGHLPDRGLRPHHGGQLAEQEVGEFRQGGRLFDADLQAYEFRRGRLPDDE